jgi:uncharacterized membrane protein YphA (DoxX/SURF4 family)
MGMASGLCILSCLEAVYQVSEVTSTASKTILEVVKVNTICNRTHEHTDLSGRGAINRYRQAIARWAPVPLRLIVGYGFFAHGLAKLSRGPEAFASILTGIGVPAPHLMSWATILTELVGGTAIMLGAFVPIISAPLAIVLLVATFTVHLRYGFSSIKLIAVTSGGAQFGPPG